MGRSRDMGGQGNLEINREQSEEKEDDGKGRYREGRRGRREDTAREEGSKLWLLWMSKAGLDGTWSNLVQWQVSLLTAGGFEQDEF